jgi:dTDP-4-dehydrorhamnose 3,5-epimerase
VNVFIAGTLNPLLVRIPPGIMHGWKALSSPEVLVVNFQSHVYDPADELKFPWDCVLESVWEPRNG